MLLRNPTRSWLAIAAAVLCFGDGRPSRADKELPTSEAFYQQAVKESDGKQWKPIFNGKDLDGWKVVLANAKPGEDLEKIYQVVDKEIHVYRDTPAGKKMPYGVLVTDDSYSHYRLRFEYRWGEKKFAPREKQIRDAGLLYHVIGPEKVWPMSVECQVQEGDTGDIFTVYTQVDVPVDASGKKFQDLSSGGKLATFYRPNGVTRAIKSKTAERDGWNSVEVVVRGDRAVHLVNGTINNYCVNMKAPQGPSKALLPLQSGRIAFQAECAEVLYRNIEILPLDEPPATTLVPADESKAPVPPLEPAESLAAWRVRDGYRVELVAAEPLTIDPVAIDWGHDGELWVAEMADYPNGMNGNGEPGGRIRVLQDTDGDGRYDRSSLFLDGVNFPTGVVVWNEGVIVTAAPEIFYAADTDGDGRCDVRKTLFSGFQEGNQQLRVNGLRWGLDGWLYCASGSHKSIPGLEGRIRSHATGKSVAVGTRDFRFHPETGAIEPVAGPSQFGRNRDDWGNWFGVQNSYPLWHYVLEDRYLRRNPHVAAPDARNVLTSANPKVFPVSEIEARFHNHRQAGRFTSACSGMVYRDSLLFPESKVAHAFTCEPVHNVVQHNLLKRDGASFSLHRDAADDSPDFLASTDRWCRPVMVRTGPDGALWVVDMYRYVIEHPHWLPEEGRRAVAPYLRAGDGRGRIYRVVRLDAEDRPHIDFKARDLNELVALLDHPNGWVRDTAQRQIVSKQQAAAVPLVKAMADNAQTPQGRLHALYTLHQLETCDAKVLARALADASTDVQRHALRLAEDLDPPDERLLTQIAALVDDAHPALRLQLAFSLGEWDHPLAARALARLWIEAPKNPQLRQALLTSLHRGNVPVVLDALAGLSLKDPGTRKAYQEVLKQSFVFGQFAPLESSLTQTGHGSDDLVRSLIALKLAYEHDSGKPLAQLSAAAQAALPVIGGQARELTEAEDEPLWIRALAAELLLQGRPARSEDLDLAARLLAPSTPAEIRNVVVERLGRQKSPKMCDVLLAGWSSYSPDTRTAVLKTIAARPDWYARLDAALDEGRIRSAEIDLSIQQDLLANSSANEAARLRKHFQSDGGRPASAVLKSLRPVLSRKGDPQRGQLVFQKNCIDCHHFRGQGHTVGPNLASLSNRTPAGLLEAVIDPNKSIETKYLNYTIVSVEGRVLTGMIVNESDHSITLLRAKEEKTPILRQEIDELQSTGKSLMPEGFERTITPEQLSDLLAYLMLNDDDSAAR